MFQLLFRGGGGVQGRVYGMERTQYLSISNEPLLAPHPFLAPAAAPCIKYCAANCLFIPKDKLPPPAKHGETNPTRSAVSYVLKLKL